MLQNIFNELTAEDQSACRMAGSSRVLAAGETLYREGEPFRGSVYLLDTGEITLHRSASASRTLSSGYFMGLSSYFTGAPYSSTAIARTPSTVLEIEAASLRGLERSRPALADALNRMIAASLGDRRLGLGIGTNALSQPVVSIMSTPVLSCPARQPLAAAVQDMLTADVGSMVIETDPPSVLTFRSAARVLSSPGFKGHAPSAADAAEPLPVVEPNAPAWKAQELLRRTNSKHVLVARGYGLRGVISVSDIASLVHGSIASLTAHIQGADSLDALGVHYQGLHHCAQQLLQSNRHAGDAITGLSEVHLAIQRRCIALTLEQLLDTGAGPAPCPYALIIMGSGGRREMMLDPDQDNALVLPDDAVKDRNVAAWFEAFALALNDNLSRCGYVLCEGDIMARNPSFRKPLADWKAQVDFVTDRPTPKAARWASIMFDFSLQYGDAGLVDSLREHVCQRMQNRPRLLAFMVEDDAQGRAPLNWFNRLIATGERRGKEVIDVKRNGLRMISNAARILALAHGIGTTGTCDRLRALTRAGVLSRDFSATISDAFDDLLAIVMSHQIDQRRQGLVLDKEVAPDELSAPRRESLRVAMRAVNRLQEFLQEHVDGT